MSAPLQVGEGDTEPVNLLNFDIFWNSSRLFTREFAENPDFANAALPPFSKAIILTVSGLRTRTLSWRTQSEAPDMLDENNS